MSKVSHLFILMWNSLIKKQNGFIKIKTFAHNVRDCNVCFRCSWRRWEARSRARWSSIIWSTCWNRGSGCPLLKVVRRRSVAAPSSSNPVRFGWSSASVLLVPTSSDSSDHDGVLEQRPECAALVHHLKPACGNCTRRQRHVIRPSASSTVW